MKTALIGHLQAMGGLLRKTGPYLAIELVLPGGTLLAFLLFLYQRQRAHPSPGGMARTLVAVAERARELVRRIGSARVWV